VWSQVQKFYQVLLILGLAGLLVQGCYNIKDDDRCLDGYHYDPEGLVCVLDEDGGVEIDAASMDAEVTADASTTGDSVIGDSCEVSEECTGDVDFCAYSSHTQTGYCSPTGCSEGTCPTGWMCCDCTGIDWPVLCVDDQSTMMPTLCVCPPAS